MPYALCPMPYALCPMPYALCPREHLMLLRKAIDTYVETWLMARYCVSDSSIRLILTELALTNRSIGYKYK
jgi:hypothetical protein